MFAIYKKELRQYFFSMIGFVFLAFFLAIIGFYTWAYNFSGGVGNFEMTLGSVSFLFVILIPILTMRLIAEENHQKTDQLLYTAPLSVVKIVVGKYLAVLTLFGAGVLVIATYPLIIAHYGTGVQLSMAYSAIIGFFLLGAAYLAVGLFLSALTDSQVIAAVITFITLLMTYLMTNITNMIPSAKKSQVMILSIIWIVVAVIAYGMMKNVTMSLVILAVGEAALWIVYAVKSSLYENLLSNILNCVAISSRFDDFTLGILQYDSIVYYASISFLFVFLTVQIIKKKRFN